MVSDLPSELTVDHYDQLLRTTPHDLVWVFSSEWDELIYLNGEYEDLWGRSRDVLEENPLDFLNGIYPDDRAAVRDAMERVSAGESTEIEFRVVPGENSLRWISAYGEPIREETGEIVCIAGFVRDITRRKERERELQIRSTAIEASIDGMAILDANEEYVFVNQAHADIYGYDDPEAFIGETWRMCYDEDERERFEEEVVPTLFEDGAWRGEAVGTRKDGSTFPQALSMTVTDDGGIVCVVRDITERKQQERELEQQNERLEAFADTVSHDLRNPLNVAMGRLELAQRECDSGHLADATRALDRCSALIDDLLALAREGETVSEMGPVPLANVVERCWDNVETAEATLITETEQTIRADRSRLQQALENLLRNAVEHGGEDVTVTVGDLDDGFYVADDGPGIPEDEFEEVFVAGYSTAEDGTGLGLNIVREIADAHEWGVSVTESEADGTRFEFRGVSTPSVDG